MVVAILACFDAVPHRDGLLLVGRPRDGVSEHRDRWQRSAHSHTRAGRSTRSWFRRLAAGRNGDLSELAITCAWHHAGPGIYFCGLGRTGVRKRTPAQLRVRGDDLTRPTT